VDFDLAPDGKSRYVGLIRGERVRIVVAVDEPDLIVTIHRRRRWVARRQYLRWQAGAYRCDRDEWRFGQVTPCGVWALPPRRRSVGRRRPGRSCRTGSDGCRGRRCPRCRV